MGAFMKKMGFTVGLSTAVVEGAAVAEEKRGQDGMHTLNTASFRRTAIIRSTASCSSTTKTGC